MASSLGDGVSIEGHGSVPGPALHDYMTGRRTLLDKLDLIARGGDWGKKFPRQEHSLETSKEQRSGASFLHLAKSTIATNPICIPTQ